MNRRIARGIVKRFSAILLATSIWFIIDEGIWDNYLIFVLFYTFLAFTSITAAAVFLAESFREETDIDRLAYGTGLFVYSLFNSSSAMDVLVDKATPVMAVQLTTDIMAILSLVIFFSTGNILGSRWERNVTEFDNKKLLSLFVIFGVILFIVTQMITRVFLTNYLIILNTALIVLVLTFGGLSLRSLLGKGSEKVKLDSLRASPAILVFMLASVIVWYSSVSQINTFRLAMTQQVASTILIFLSAVISNFKSDRPPAFAYGFTVTLTMLTFLPLLATIVTEFIIIPATYFESIPAYLIIHSGAAVLSAIMAILIYLYSRVSPEWNHIPLIGVFGSWSTVEVFQIVPIFLSSYLEFHDWKSTLFVGTTASLILLIVAIRWTKRPPRITPPKNILRLPVVFLVVLSVFLALRLAFVNWLMANIVILGTGIGVLIVSLFSIFAITYFIMILHSDADKRTTIETLIVGFAAFWITPNVLRGVFEVWTIGWWVGEIILLGGTIIGPALIGVQYLSAMDRESKMKSESDMLADIVMHDISNKLQAISIGLELQQEASLQQDIREAVLGEAIRGMKQAVSLIRGVRKLKASKAIDSQRLEQMDLLKSIKRAYDKQPLSTSPAEFLCLKDFYYVHANALLDDLFEYLFRGIRASREYLDPIRIEIREVVDNRDSKLQVSITIPEPLGSPGHDEILVQDRTVSSEKDLFMEVFKSLSANFNVTTVIDRSIGNPGKITCIHLTFPIIE